MGEIRDTLARLCHLAYLRQGAFTVLASNRVPCSTAREVPLIGERAAGVLAKTSYLLTRCRILGYQRSEVIDRLTERAAGLVVPGSEVAAPYSTAALGRVKEAHRAARRAESHWLVDWQRVREGEYRSEIRAGSVELVSEFDMYQGCPDLVLLFPVQRLSLRPEQLFTVDADAYLAFEEIAEFERRYELVLRLIEHVRMELLT